MSSRTSSGLSLNGGTRILNAVDAVEQVEAKRAAATRSASFWLVAAMIRTLCGAFTRFAHAARSYSCKRPPRRSRRFSVIGCVPVHVVADLGPLGGAKSRLR